MVTARDCAITQSVEKCFVPFPSLNDASQCITMLEMKLIVLVDFPQRMTPGVFVTCSDDLELFESAGADFTRPGFTAMTHPAPVSIGLSHGVFVLDPSDVKDLLKERDSASPSGTEDTSAAPPQYSLSPRKCMTITNVDLKKYLILIHRPAILA